MMLQTLTAALTLLISAQEPPADPGAQDLALLHSRTQERCESQPRGENETAEACAQRRAAALIATYGSVAGALGATAGWGPRPASDAGTLGFPTLTDSLPAEGGYSRSTAAPAQQPKQPPQLRCRRESTRSEDGNSVSSSIVCGNNPDAQNSAREMLERLRDPD